MARKPIVRLQESFKIFVDKFNVLSNNVGEPTELNTYNDSDLVTVINEIDATFDAYEGEILYPNPDVPFRTAGQLPNTHLKISTNQNGGTDIDIDAGQDFLVDAIRHINLTSVNFDGDYSGNHSIDIDGNRTSRVDGTSLDSVGGTYDLTTGGSFTQNTTGNYTVDATGYADLDFDGLANLNVGGTYDLTTGGTYTQATTGDIDISGTGDYTLDVGGDADLISLGDISLSMPFQNTLSLISTYAANTSFNDSVQISFDRFYDHPSTHNNSFGMETVIPGSLELNMDHDLVVNTGNHDETIPSSVVRWSNQDLTYLQWNISNQLGASLAQSFRETYFKPTTSSYSFNRYTTIDDSATDSVGGAMTLTGNSTYDINTKSTFTVQTGIEGQTTASIDLNATGDIYMDAGGDIYLDAGDSDIIFRKNGPTNNYARWQMGTEGNPNNFKLNVGKGDFTVDVAGDIVLDAGDSDILFNRQGNTFIKTRMGRSWDNNRTTIEYPRGTVEHEAALNYIVDAYGDIILDADGNHFIFRNGDGGGDGGDSAQITFANDGLFTFSTPSHFVINADEDVVLDAGGGDIDFKVDNTTRIAYGLGNTNKIDVTGNLTETTAGDKSDSATGTYHIGATGNFDIDTRGTLVVNTGGNNVQYTTGHIDLNATENIVLDAGGDIYLDAGDSDIYFQRNNDTFAKWQMGIDGQPNALQLSVPRGNFQIDAANDIVLDAGDSDIVFKRQGITFARHRLGVSGDATQTRVEYNQGPLFLDVSGDIIMEADGGDVYLKDDGVEYLRFHHSGGGDGRIDNNGIPVITFSDSDATFENDVVVDRLLDVNAFTHKNGSFSPLSSGTDRYIGTLNTFNNGDGGGGRLIIHDGHIKTTRTVDIAVQNIGGTANIKYAVSGTGAGGDCDIQLKYVVRSGEVDKVDFFLASSGGKSFTQYYYWLTSHLNVDDTAPTSSGATTIDLDDKIGILARQEGNVGIKKTNPLVELDVDGRIAAEAIDVDSADIGDLNFNGNTITNTTAGIILDVSGDIILDADGNDIKFKNGGGNDEVTHTLYDNASYAVTTPSHLHFDVGEDIILDAEGNHIIFRNGTGNDSAQIKFTDTGAFTLNTPLGLTFDAVADITLDAGGGDIFLKDDGNQYGCLRATIGNDLIIKSGTTTAMTFSGANVTMEGQITLPSADLDTTEKTVHGAINEVDSDLGERTSLSSFYDGHKDDIVTALNRVAARVIDVYDAQGNLLNS